MQAFFANSSQIGNKSSAFQSIPVHIQKQQATASISGQLDNSDLFRTYKTLFHGIWTYKTPRSGAILNCSPSSEQ